MIGPRKYPKVVKIGDEYWDIKFVRKVDKANKDVGECCPSSNQIRIKQGQSREQIFRTAIHEVVHACEFTYDFELDHENVYRLEEAICDFVLDLVDKQ